MSEEKEQAKKLLAKMPSGNARVYCENMIQMTVYPGLKNYWENVKSYIDDIINEK